MHPPARVSRSTSHLGRPSTRPHPNTQATSSSTQPTKPTSPTCRRARPPQPIPAPPGTTPSGPSSSRTTQIFVTAQTIGRLRREATSGTEPSPPTTPHTAGPRRRSPSRHREPRPIRDPAAKQPSSLGTHKPSHTRVHRRRTWTRRHARSRSCGEMRSGHCCRGWSPLRADARLVADYDGLGDDRAVFTSGLRNAVGGLAAGCGRESDRSEASQPSRRREARRSIALTRSAPWHPGLGEHTSHRAPPHRSHIRQRADQAYPS